MEAIDGLHNALVAMPWWVGPPAAAFAWFAVGSLIPEVLRAFGGTPGPANPTATVFHLPADILAGLSPLVGLGVLVIWMVSLVTRRRNAARLDGQRDLKSLRALSWRDFERLMAEVFRREGFAASERAKGPDGVVDLVLRRGGQRLLVQCKQWRTQRVGVAKVRELWAWWRWSGPRAACSSPAGGTPTRPGALPRSWSCGWSTATGCSC